MKDYTVEFLRAIAERLSSRESCRRLEYIVNIGCCDNPIIPVDATTVVKFYPERSVYPDIHHRHKTDLKDVVDHVMRAKFYDTVYDTDDEYGRARFIEGTLTPGVYKYVLSFDKKRRQWVKLY